MMNGWHDILAPGEHVLWQGQPSVPPRLSPRQIPVFLFGMMFAGFAVFWMSMAMRAGTIWVFGLIHLFAGLAVAIGPIFVMPFVASRTWYSLTNRRAFFATHLPFVGPTLNVLDLSPALGIEFDGKDPGTLRFQDKATPLVGTHFDGAPMFTKIQNARDVFGLIRDIQRGKA